VAPPRDATTAVADLIRYLENGVAPEGLFAADVFGDVTLPRWRLQADNVADLLAIRAGGHPFPGEVRVERVEHTANGFTMEFEERWDHEGQRWYCREMARADVVDGTIVDLAIYCTGDWDDAQQRRHAESVRILRQ
jgi:hypothetical protein